MRTPRTPPEAVLKSGPGRAALKAWGLRADDVLAFVHRFGVTRIVTRGGRRLVHPGPVGRLTDEDRDGEPRAAHHRGRLYPHRYWRRLEGRAET